jgi:hypothetical protein
VAFRRVCTVPPSLRSRMPAIERLPRERMPGASSALVVLLCTQMQRIELLTDLFVKRLA